LGLTSIFKDNSARCRFRQYGDGQVEGILSFVFPTGVLPQTYSGQYKLMLKETYASEDSQRNNLWKNLSNAVLTKKLLRKFGAVEAKLER